MTKVVEVKEGVLGNVFAIVLLVGLSVSLWWGFHSDHFLGPVILVFDVVWLGCCTIFIRNILKPKSAFLGIDGDRLVWSVRTKESATANATSISLRSLRGLEFVLPKMKFEANARNYVLSELFLVDAHGARHRLPMELWPGIHRQKIVAALRAELPGLEVVELVADSHIEPIKTS